MLLAGIALIGVAVFLAAGGWGMIPEDQLQMALQKIPLAQGFTGVRIMALTTAFLAVIGIVLLFIAIIGFIMTWGLWAGKKWARTITMILSVLGLLVALFSLPGSLISMLLHLLVLYYLTRPHVKAYYYK